MTHMRFSRIAKSPALVRIVLMSALLSSSWARVGAGEGTEASRSGQPVTGEVGGGIQH